MPIKTFKLYGVKEVDYNAVIAKYKELCSAGIVEINWEDYFNATSPRTETVIKAPRTGLIEIQRYSTLVIHLKTVSL